MTIIDSTLAGNTANQYGGAIDNVSTLTVISTTIAYNSVDHRRHRRPASTSTPAPEPCTTPSSTSIPMAPARPRSPTTSPARCPPRSAYNLIGVGGLINGVNNNLVGVTAPGLAPGLASNGGPTQTIALLAGSPALGAGSATIPGVTIPGTDQRGVARLAGAFDIGAYQFSTTNSLTQRVGSLTSTVSVAAPTTAASIVSSQVTATQPTTPSIVSTPNPFKGRRLGSKAHHATKASAHPAVHHAVKTVAVKQTTPSVRIAKHR